MFSERTPALATAGVAGLWLWTASTGDGSSMLVHFGLLSARYRWHLVTLPGRFGVGLDIRSGLALLFLLVAVYALVWPLTQIKRNPTEEDSNYKEDGYRSSSVGGVGGGFGGGFNDFGMGGGSGFNDPFGGAPGMGGDPFGGGMGGPGMGGDQLGGSPGMGGPPLGGRF